MLQHADVHGNVTHSAAKLASSWLKPFETSGIRPSMLSPIKQVSKRAEEHLCLRVQIINNVIFVVGSPGSRLLDTQLHRCDSATVLGDENENFCALEQNADGSMSRRGDGAEGCRSQPRGWERHRLHVALRLLHIATTRPPGLRDCEMRLCGDDTCHGVWEQPPRARPLFTMATCMDSPTLPLPQWNAEWDAKGGRDVDLAVWDTVRQERRHRSMRALERRNWKCRESIAAFRGSANQLHTYNIHWGAERRVRRAKTEPSNWNVSGRWALAQHKLRAPQLLNVRLSVLRRSDKIFQKRSQPLQYKKLMSAVSNDTPRAISLEAQARRFKYLLHLEGHGGWADRLKHLLLSGAAVMKQDMGVQEWYEPLLRPGQHFLPVASDLSNLTEVIEHARAHDADTRRVAHNSVEWMSRMMSATMVIEYTLALYTGYAKLWRSREAVQRRPDTIRFACWPALIVDSSGSGSCLNHSMHGKQLTDCGFIEDEPESNIAQGPRVVFNSLRAALLHHHQGSPRQQEISEWKGLNESRPSRDAEASNVAQPYSTRLRTPCVAPGWLRKQGG